MHIEPVQGRSLLVPQTPDLVLDQGHQTVAIIRRGDLRVTVAEGLRDAQQVKRQVALGVVPAAVGLKRVGQPFPAINQPVGPLGVPFQTVCDPLGVFLQAFAEVVNLGPSVVVPEVLSAIDHAAEIGNRQLGRSFKLNRRERHPADKLLLDPSDRLELIEVRGPGLMIGRFKLIGEDEPGPQAVLHRVAVRDVLAFLGFRSAAALAGAGASVSLVFSGALGASSTSRVAIMATASWS